VTPVDERIAQLASAQKGNATFAELRALGISATEIKHRVRRGALIRVYRGVYRVGHRAPSVEAEYLAAVKACGDGALLAGRAAAWLYGLIKGNPPPPEVVAPKRHRIPGIETRRRRIHPLDRSSFRGIPILPVPAVLVDIAPRLDDEALARACHEAGVRYRTTPPTCRPFSTAARGAGTPPG
jgi:predicted transcriptional regulator of viral defense system